MKNEEAIVFWEKLRETFEENERAEKNPFAKMHYKTSIEAIDAALEALNQGAAWTSKAEPLTMEQLLEMDGQPVWIMEAPDWGHWELFRNRNARWPTRIFAPCQRVRRQGGILPAEDTGAGGPGGENCMA